MIRVFRGLFVLAFALAVSACGTEFPVEPTAPTPTPTEEPLFTGTLQINGEVVQPFAVTAAGDVVVLVTGLSDSNGPQPTDGSGAIRIGLGLGEWDGQACAMRVPTLYNPAAAVSTIITGGSTRAGNLCIDVKNSQAYTLTEPVSFEIKITHF